jgi:hypothetical protein
MLSAWRVKPACCEQAISGQSRIGGVRPKSSDLPLWSQRMNVKKQRGFVTDFKLVM